MSLSVVSLRIFVLRLPRTSSGAHGDQTDDPATTLTLTLSLLSGGTGAVDTLSLFLFLFLFFLVSEERPRSLPLLPLSSSSCPPLSASSLSSLSPTPSHPAELFHLVSLSYLPLLSPRLDLLSQTLGLAEWLGRLQRRLHLLGGATTVVLSSHRLALVLQHLLFVTDAALKLKPSQRRHTSSSTSSTTSEVADLSQQPTVLEQLFRASQWTGADRQTTLLDLCVQQLLQTQTQTQTEGEATEKEKEDGLTLLYGALQDLAPPLNLLSHHNTTNSNNTAGSGSEAPWSLSLAEDLRRFQDLQPLLLLPSSSQSTETSNSRDNIMMTAIEIVAREEKDKLLAPLRTLSPSLSTSINRAVQQTQALLEYFGEEVHSSKDKDNTVNNTAGLFARAAAVWSVLQALRRDLQSALNRATARM